MFLDFVVVLGFVHGVFTAVITTAPRATMLPCTYQGEPHYIGSFNPTPCETCVCSADGQVTCIMIDCAIAMCVDPVKRPDQCCATCPNGFNCMYGSTVIKNGDIYKPDNQTQCTCPSYMAIFGMGSRSLKAVCIALHR